MARRTLHTTLAALTTLVLLLAGCGDGEAGAAGSDDPYEIVSAAFTGLDTSVTDVSFSLDATAEQLVEAFEVELTGDPAEQAMLDLLAEAELRMAGSEAGMAMSFVLDDATVVETRVIDQVMYLRVDVDAFIDIAASIDPAAAAEMEETLGMLPLVAADDPSLAFLADVVAGGWVSMEVPEDSAYADEWKSGTDPESLDEDVAAAFEQIIDENTVITPDGQARGGDRYIVEVRAADLITALASNPLTAEALDATSDDADPDAVLEEMRAEGLSDIWELDVVIIDGVLSSIRIDFADISTEAPAGASVPFLITFAESPSAPSVPESHTPIDPKLLNEMFLGMDGVGQM